MKIGHFLCPIDVFVAQVLEGTFSKNRM